jgi:hypothetical protein
MRSRRFGAASYLSGGVAGRGVPEALLQTLVLSVGIGFEQGSDRVMSDFKGRHFESWSELILSIDRAFCL